MISKLLTSARADRTGICFLGILLLFGCGCVIREMPADPRSPRSLPPRIRAHFQYAKGFEVEGTKILSESSNYTVSEVRLKVPDEETDARRELILEFFAVDRPGRHPAVVVTPILEGENELSRILARSLASAGISAVILDNPKEILEKTQSPKDLEFAFKKGILDLRRTVDWLASRKGVDPTRLGSAGISLGAIRNGVLACVEPRLRAHVLMLGGANLSSILSVSVERKVERYRRARLIADGGEAEFRRLLSEAFFYDCEDLGRSVDPRSILMMLARFDRSVPLDSGELLRARLGMPTTHIFPAGHYSSIVFLPYALTNMVEFFRLRFR